MKMAGPDRLTNILLAAYVEDLANTVADWPVDHISAEFACCVLTGYENYQSCSIAKVMAGVC